MDGILTVLCAWAVAAWRILLDFLMVANRVRFSAILVVAGGFILNYHDQGQEIVLLVASGGIGMKTLFAASVAAWALSAWYCARTLCDRPFARSETPALRAITDHFPRILGATAFAAVGIAFFRQGAINTAGAFALLTIAFYAFAYFRRRGQLGALLGLEEGPQHTREVAPNPFLIDGATARFYRFLAAAATVAMAATLIWPVEIGTLAGPGVVAMVGFALIIPVGTLAILMGLRSNFPVITALLAMAVLFSLFNDNHALRQAPPVGTAEQARAASAARPTLEDAFIAWHNAQCPAPEQRDRCRPPLVLVATAGGGSRAAYWTASVLGALSDRSEPGVAVQRFEDALFAMSGVSGGALGAVIHRALVSDRRADRHREPACAGKDGVFRSCGTQVAAGEFLGPVMATLLYGDLLQRFLPVPVFPDRAGTLEKSWEARWRKILPKSKVALSDGLLALWADNAKKPWPAIYLNGTHVETARRIITSNIALEKSVYDGVLVHADAFDFYAIHKCDIPASTAAHNTARFPYVAPAGRIRTDCGYADWGHIVDGGYFENFGAQTTHETLRALIGYAKKTARGFVPVVIQISSNPDFDDRFTKDDHDQLVAAARKSHPLAREALSPPRAFMGLRGAHGRRAFAGLNRAVNDAAAQAGAGAGGAFAHFRMCSKDADGNERTPALGWSLSSNARETIDGFLTAGTAGPKPDDTATGDTVMADAAMCRKKNAEALNTVLRALARPG